MKLSENTADQLRFAVFFMQKNKKIKYLIAKNQTWSYIYKTDIKSGHSAVA